jgi:hypothetical protein
MSYVLCLTWLNVLCFFPKQYDVLKFCNVYLYITLPVYVESVTVCNMACLGLRQHALATFIVDLPVFGRGEGGLWGGGGGVGLNLGLLTYNTERGPDPLWPSPSCNLVILWPTYTFLQVATVFRIRIRIGSGFNQVSGFGIRIRNPDPDPGGQKLPTKIGKKFQKFHVLKCWMFSFKG